MRADTEPLEEEERNRGSERVEIQATDDRGGTADVPHNPEVSKMPRWELALAVGEGHWDLATTYEHSFAPVLRAQPEATGAANHHLALGAEGDPAWRVGLRRLLGSRLGLQFLFGKADAELGGVSSAYQVGIEYTSVQPPDYVPRPETFTSSMPWPDPRGDLEAGFVCVNALLRVENPRRVRFALSGGPTLLSFEADFTSLGYQTFWLGGHGVLFTEIYEIRVAADRTRRLGANLGAEIDFRFGERWAVLAEVRFFLSPSIDVELRAAEIVNRDQVIRALSIEEIEPHLNLSRLELDPSFSTFSIGLRVGL
jgi:hypothetical protein